MMREVFLRGFGCKGVMQRESVLKGKATVS
jgi:hypothetical protein